MDFRRMIDPYYSWKRAKKPPEKVHNNQSKKQIYEENKDLQVRGKNPISVITQSEQFFQVDKLRELPASGEMWYYHDKKMIGVLAKVDVGALSRFDGQGFRGARNEKLDIYPKYIANNLSGGKSKNKGIPKEKWVDATHLIPFGLHGREDDARLMVQWLQKQNQVEMRAFEQSIKKLDFSVYWLTLIAKTSEGAKWYYKVYRAEDMKLVKKLTLEWETELVWN
jgi:hypothetical protein